MELVASEQAEEQLLKWVEQAAETPVLSLKLQRYVLLVRVSHVVVMLMKSYSEIQDWKKLQARDGLFQSEGAT